MTSREKRVYSACILVVACGAVLAVVLGSCQSVAQEHGGQTLMRLARTPRAKKSPSPALSQPSQPSIVPPALAPIIHTNRPPPVPMNYTVLFPPTEAGKLYSLWRSTNLINWTMIRSNMLGPNSTNADVWTTNKGESEFYQMRKQTNFYPVTMP